MERHAPRCSRVSRASRLLTLRAVAVLVVLSGCGTSSRGQEGHSTVTPTATGTTAPTVNIVSRDPACAAALPTGAPIQPSAMLVYPLAYPPDSVATIATQSAGGTDLFSVFAFDACSPTTSVAAVRAFFATPPPSWSPSSDFPFDGGLMQGCGTAVACWSASGAGPYDYLVLDQLQNAGQGAVTYYVRYAVSPDAASCPGPGTGGPDFLLPNFGPGPQVPLPPMSRAGENDAPHLHAWDVCSPGTVASISTFMRKELPATGWKAIATSNAACSFTSCWANSGQTISWSVSDPAQWFVGYH